VSRKFDKKALKQNKSNQRLVGMKRTAVILTLILTLLITAQVCCVNANFYSVKTTPPPPEATPPKIIVVYPENLSSAQLKSNESLSFEIIEATYPTKYSTPGVPYLYYKGDWMANESSMGQGTIFNLPLNNLSSGVHHIVVGASQHFYYATEETLYDGPYDFYIESLMNFTFSLIDVTPASISFLTIENKTYTTSAVPLNFTVNELVSQLSYSLDGKDNVTIAGNTTLTGLSNGQHNLIVYSTDTAGNVGASETFYFILDVPFPTTLVMAFIVLVVVTVVGLLVYFKRRNKSKLTT
jgi:hypothetical protein